MSGLEKIVSEIQRTALAEADSIRKEAEQQAKTILKEQEDVSSKRCKTILEDAQAKAEEIKTRGSSGVQLQHRQNVLATKQELIRDTIKKAIEAVAKLPEDTYFDILSKIASTVDIKGSATLAMNQKDLDHVAHALLEKFPEGATITVSDKPADILGGFLITTEEVVINCSIEALFDRYQVPIVDCAQTILFN